MKKRLVASCTFTAIIAACAVTIKPRQSELVATLNAGFSVEEAYEIFTKVGVGTRAYPAKRIPHTQLISKEFISSEGVIISSVYFPQENKIDVVISNQVLDKKETSDEFANLLYGELVKSGCCSSIQLSRKE